MYEITVHLVCLMTTKEKHNVSEEIEVKHETYVCGKKNQGKYLTMPYTCEQYVIVRRFIQVYLEQNINASLM